MQTFALRECMLKNREYYAPVLEEEVRAELAGPRYMYCIDAVQSSWLH